MDIDINTTYSVAAYDLEDGMVLQINDAPAEVKSVKIDGLYTRVTFVLPQPILPKAKLTDTMTVRSNDVLTRYHEN